MPSELNVSEELRDDLDEAHILIARQPQSSRLYPNMNVPPLPPRLWERLRQQLQIEYRRARGEQHAVLVVELGDPT